MLIQDFQTPASYTFVGFEGLGSASIVADPAVAGTKLNGLQLVSVNTGNPWQGAEVVLATKKIRLLTDKTVKIDIYATQAFTLLAKVEMGTGPVSACSQSYTTPGAWQTLTFTFNQSLDGTGVANGDYQKIVFFPNWKVTNDGFNSPANFTVNIDNIVAEEAAIVPDPAPTTLAPTPPNRNAADVYSLFSDSYAARTVENWNASWDVATSTDMVVATGNIKKVVGLGYLGVEFINNRIDATAYTNLHIDIWVPSATLDKSFNLKFSNWNGGAGEANAIQFSTTNASSPALPNPNTGTWIPLDIPLTSMAGARNDLAQFIITSDLGTVYFDNLYLYKGTALGVSKFETSNVKMYPNPVSNELNIEATSSIQKIAIYNVLGQEVLSSNPKSNSAKVQTSSLQSGVYLVKTTIDDVESTSKFIKN